MMRIAYTLALVVVIPLVAVWAAAMAVHTSIHQGWLLISDVWK